MAEVPDSGAAAAAGAHGGADKGKGKAGGATKPSLVLVLAMIGGPLLLGGGAGALLIGPQLVAGKTAGAAEPGHKKQAKKKSEHGGEGEKASVFKIDNLIVNPAGSQGAHFLMTQIAIQCADDQQVAFLKSNEFKIKDLIISVIERESLEDLTQPGARDTIKVHILNAVTPLLHGGAAEGANAADGAAGHSPLQVFLPQFVIQ